MKSYFILIFALAFTLPSCSQDTKTTGGTTTFYFIRHAEKDRSNEENKDPNLKEEGLLRAAKWSIALQHIKFDAIYSTDYNRTKQTAQPTAEKNGLGITIYDPNNVDGKVFTEANKGKTVLIVGHSNTTPAFVNAVLGSQKYQDIADDNNANLYIVTISPSGEMSDMVLVVN